MKLASIRTRLAPVLAAVAGLGFALEGAIVVRAPDNVLYLTNFWGMKGYDACVFPREGEPTLICLEASAEDADRTASAFPATSTEKKRSVAEAATSMGAV